MTPQQITDAIAEANRFIQAADQARQRLRYEATQRWAAHATKEVGAMKRASMDLSRKLAELRR